MISDEIMTVAMAGSVYLVAVTIMAIDWTHFFSFYLYLFDYAYYSYLILSYLHTIIQIFS